MASTRTTQEPAAVPPEDAWAYTPEHLAAVKRSSGQRGYRLGPDDVDRLIAEAEAAHRDGKDYHVSESELARLEAAHAESGESRPA